jgi:hypothetical protein
MMLRLLCFCVLLPSVFAAGPHDIVVLQGGSEMQGTLESLRGGRLRFQPRWSENAAVFPVSELEAVFFGDSGAPPERPAGHRITFRDGDRLTGRLLARRENILRFAPASGVVVDILKERVLTLETLPPDRDRLLKQGMDLNQWQTNLAAGHMNAVRVMPARGINNMPVQLNHMMQTEPVLPQELGGTWFFPASKGISIFRELPDLPERFRLDYSIRTPGGNFLLNVGLFTHQPLHRGAGGMFVMHQNLQVHAQIFPEVFDANDPRPPITNWRNPVEFGEGEWQHFEVYVDRPGKRGWMMLNGNQVQEWEIQMGSDTMTSRWLSFQIQHNQGGLQLGGLELTRWDGTFPSREIETFGPTAGEAVPRGRGPNEAEIRFRGYPDLLTLRIREITSTHVVADGYGFEGPVRLPREQLAGLRFPWLQPGQGPVPGLSIDLDTPVLQMELLPGRRP